jgi:peptidoglycan hydrolase-like protein with peptidoglycan-binding domain
MDWLRIVQLAIQYGPLVKGAIDTAFSNDDLITKIKNIAGPIVPLLEQIGKQLFPKAADILHLVGGAVAAFDPNVTRWLQGALNNLIEPSLTPQLVVDGIYGPLTRAAVETFQKQMGLIVDGLAGTITRAAIDALLAKRAEAIATTARVAPKV